MFPNAVRPFPLSPPRWKSVQERNVSNKRLEFLLNGDFEIVSGERGYALGSRRITEGDGKDREQDFLVVGRRGAAHSNTQEKGGKSIDNLLGYREKGDKKWGKRETKDVTWGSQASPQVYYKYSPSGGKPRSPISPP